MLVIVGKWAYPAPCRRVPPPGAGQYAWENVEPSGGVLVFCPRGSWLIEKRVPGGLTPDHTATGGPM
jgi:hypothetical protein